MADLQSNHSALTLTQDSQYASLIKDHESKENSLKDVVQSKIKEIERLKDDNEKAMSAKEQSHKDEISRLDGEYKAQKDALEMKKDNAI